MTTYNVSIPDNKDSFFREFLELIGAKYEKKQDTFELSDEQKMISYMAEHEMVARKDIQAELGFSQSKTIRTLKTLLERDMIIASGGGKNIRYSLIRK